jgi:hypothetical protein
VIVAPQWHFERAFRSLGRRCRSKDGEKGSLKCQWVPLAVKVLDSKNECSKAKNTPLLLSLVSVEAGSRPSQTSCLSCLVLGLGRSGFSEAQRSYPVDPSGKRMLLSRAKPCTSATKCVPACQTYLRMAH